MVLKYFSVLGYASIVLWLAVPFLWLLHVKTKPRRWWYHIALAVALVAYGLALINSKTYVNRIQIDRSEEIAEAQARQEKARQAALDARQDDVANVKFAEDDASDYMDEGGMDDADLKYMQTFKDDAEPEWKKQKKSRSQTTAEDDSLEGLLDKTEKEKGAETAGLEDAEAEPIMMPEKHKMAANRIDGFNLKLIRLLMLVGLGLVVVDYLKRANVYDEAYLPLPLPSAWTRGVTPLQPVRCWPVKQRRTMPEELAWLLRRGENCLYLAGDAAAIEQVPEKMWRIRKPCLMPVDIIRVTDEEPVSADFIFETLWYGRSSFAVGSSEHASRVLKRLMDLLEERKGARAHVRQTVHVVWDLEEPLPEETMSEFERLGAATGFTLVVRPA